MKIPRTHIGRIGKLAAFVACLAIIGVGGTIFIPQVSLGATTPFASVTYPNIQGCPVNKRFENWGRFIKDGASFSDFYANWGDIFTRNSCQQQDIFSIQKTIEGVQNQLRDKIFLCQTDGLDALSVKIHELQFELEYVRNVVDTDDERPAPNATKGEVRQPAAIVQRMRDSSLLKDGIISSDRFNTLFAETQQKYAARVIQYKKCIDPDWAALTQQWNTFTSTWAGLKPATQQSAKSLTKRVDALNALLEAPSQHNGQFMKRYLGGLLDIKMNGLTPERNLAAVYKDLTRDATTGATKNSPDYNTYLDQAENEHARYSKEEEDAKRKSYYEGLFRYSSDASGTEIVEEIKKTNKVIENTRPIIDTVRSCTALIAERQCGGK